MTDKMTFQIDFDHDMNVEIKSNSLSEEVKSTLEDMINERENNMDYSTLPEIDHVIKSNSFGFEVDISTSEGEIVEIIEKFNEEQKELQELQQYEQDMYLTNLNEHIGKELDSLSL
jgi:hypothetical protein